MPGEFPRSAAKRTVRVQENSFDRVPRTGARRGTASYPRRGGKGTESEGGRERVCEREKKGEGEAAGAGVAKMRIHFLQNVSHSAAHY